MTLNTITQADISERALFYSRWHSISTPTRGSHIDIKIAQLVGPIISFGSSTGLFIVCTYQTELVTLDENYTEMSGFKIWEIDIGTMYLEDQNGIRYLGTIESMEDKGEEGLLVSGTSCIFTDNIDEAYIESFFTIRNLIPKPNESTENGKDYSDAINHIKLVEPIMREILPEKFI